MTVELNFYTEARSAVRAARNASSKLPATIFVTGIEAKAHSPETFGGKPRFVAQIFFDYPELSVLQPYLEMLAGFELIADRKAEEAPPPEAPKPEAEEKQPRKAAENRRVRTAIKDTDVFRQTGDVSGIGKGIHLAINSAFDGTTPLSEVVAGLLTTLSPPRAKGWEEDPVRYIREYVSYNLGQGALVRVED